MCSFPAFVDHVPFVRGVRGCVRQFGHLPPAAAEPIDVANAPAPRNKAHPAPASSEGYVCWQVSWYTLGSGQAHYPLALRIGSL